MATGAGRAAVAAVLKKLRSGQTPEQVKQGLAAGRKKAGRTAKVTEANTEKVRDLLQENNSSKANSQRAIARKAKISLSSVSRVIKRQLKWNPPKRARAATNTENTLTKRQSIAKSIVALFDSGELAAGDIFFADETWIDQDCDGQLNSQNERIYFPPGTKRDDVMAQLEKPKAQRAPGLMVHLAVSSHGGGVMLKPFRMLPGETITAEVYQQMLAGDVMRQIDVVTGGERYWLQQDLAPAHSAEKTKEFLDKEGARVLPWLPAGADLNPLDVFANSALEAKVRGRDVSSRGKLLAETAKAIDELSRDQAFMETTCNACRAFEKRVR